MSVLPVLFWQRSVLEKPKDREITCHPTAWDFYDGQDFRSTICTTLPEKRRVWDSLMLQSSWSTCQTTLAKLNAVCVCVCVRKGRCFTYQRFHEAVGDVIALSVSTPKHLRKIGLLKDEQNDEDSTMNYLYLQALLKVAYLPFAYLMDLWRWDVFNGNITSHDYNCRWWELREKYQGIEPPVDRTEEDFDPGAKFHIVTNVPYIRYFVSHVIQFQIHRALCLEAGEYVQNDPSKPLYNCDIYESIPAGERLKAMLQLGSSVPWQDALEVGTGSRRMDASALLDYFKPLHEWLKAENARTGERVGWGPSRRKCVASREDLKPAAAAGQQQLSKDKEEAETSR
ncbi:Angiotensin-converting enzyme [Gryllus bimaculatus]|nr:Angiotensin-converting enzyme [Gryllus bimaculatus]